MTIVGLKVPGNPWRLCEPAKRVIEVTTVPAELIKVTLKVRGCERLGLTVPLAIPFESSGKLPSEFIARGLVEVTCAVATVPTTGVPSSHLSVAVMLNVDAGLNATSKVLQFVELPRVNVIDSFPATFCWASARSIVPGPGSATKPVLGWNVLVYADVTAATRKSPECTGMLGVSAVAEEPEAAVD